MTCRVSIATALFAPLLALSANTVAAQTTPNIRFTVGDDIGYMNVSAHGGGIMGVQSTGAALLPPSGVARARARPPDVIVIRADDLGNAEQTLPQGVRSIRFGRPTLAPMAFTLFCLRYANECKPQQLLFRGGRMKLTDRRWGELESVNRSVNSSILPRRGKGDIVLREWVLDPALGDCNDYAVTKRHQLIAKGWPARNVLLSEVVTVEGEHHLVAVVRTNRGDLVLDNLTERIMPSFRKPYRWVRIQTPDNPNYWASVSRPNAGQVAVRTQVVRQFAVDRHWNEISDRHP